MAPRTQSPSSINIYYQCPRKYFYQYIKKLATKPNIHLVRGKAIHTALENFFELDISRIHKENYKFELQTLLHDLFRQEWGKLKSELDELDMDSPTKIYYYNESKAMLNKWFKDFTEKMDKEMQHKSLQEAFNNLTPKTEEHFKSEKHQVRGFIDAVHEWSDGVYILDYKTSRKDHISDEYRLQLGIYALLYHQKYGEKPKGVGINFLRHGERILEVDDVLIKEAEEACFDIQRKTQSEDIKDYPKNQTPLCKWSTGQCDFYEQCIKDD